MILIYLFYLWLTFIEINYSLIFQHTGDTTTSNTCQCNDTFVFNKADNTCACPLPKSIVDKNGKCFACGSLKNGNGTGNAVNGLCECNSTFVFNQDSNTCTCSGPQENSYINNKGLCVSCASLAEGNGTGLANIESRVCYCKPTYVFSQNGNSISCLCALNSIILEGQCFLCTSLRGKNSTGIIKTNAQSASCECFSSFVFNTTTKVCQCPDPNSYISLAGACISCTGLGDANQDTRTCGCPSTYVYNANTNKCSCPPFSILTSDNKCFVCFTKRYDNATGLIDPNNSSLCQCYFSFIFNLSSFSCQCPESNSYVSDSRVCVSCNRIGNNTNEVFLNNKSCQCLQTYIYDGKLNRCLCPHTSIIIDGLCFACSTLRHKNSSGQINPFNTKQCQCLSNFVFNTATKVCECPNDVNYFVSKDNKCVSCLNIENGNGEAFTENKTCKCNDSYIYNTFSNKCVCPRLSIVLQTKICFVCSTLANKNSSGLVNRTTGNTCQCTSTFFFNPITQLCQCPTNQFVSKLGRCISCTGIGNGTDQFNSVTKECVCIDPTYVYSLSQNRCLCARGSAIVAGQCFHCLALRGKNSSGQVNATNSKVCSCSNTFVFNIQTKVCECPNDANSFVSSSGRCVSCIGIENGLNDGVDTAAKACICKASFIYNARLNKCQCPRTSIILEGQCFVCSSLRGRNSSGQISSTNSNECQCSITFVFNSLTKICECPNEANSFVSKSGRCVSCIGIQNGLNDFADRTNQACVCKSSYVYAPSFNRCQCPPSSIIIDGQCFTCSTLRNKNSSGGVNATTGNTCRCFRSYVFNPTTKICQCPDDANSYLTASKLCVSCTGIENGTGAAKTNGCVCNDNTFVYNPTLNKCLCPSKYIFTGSSCSPPPKSQIAKETVCPQNLEWDIFLQTCSCRPGFALNGNVCIECKSIANSTGEAFDKISCICEEGYLWHSQKLTCE